MSVREWCEEGGPYVNDDNSMMASARTASSRPQDFETRDKTSIHTTGWTGCEAPWSTQWICLVSWVLASTHEESSTQTQRDGRILVQSQVTMGSGLVDLSCDSGWDGASRCRTTVGLDEHRTVVRGTLRKTMFRSSCSQTR